MNTGVLGVREPSTCGRSHPHEFEETLKFYGKPLFPERIAYTVPYRLFRRSGRWRLYAPALGRQQE